MLLAGVKYIKLGKHEEALKCLNDGLWITQQKGDQNGIAASYGTLGDYYVMMNMYNEALECFDKCLVICVDLGDKTSEGRTCSSFGHVYIKLNKYDDAKKYLNRGLEIAQEVGNRENECICYLYLGDLHDCLAQYDESLKYAKLSLKIAEKIDYLEGKWVAYQRLGNAYKSLGRIHEAIDYHKRFLQYVKQSGDKMSEGTAYNALAMCYCKIQDYDKATSCAEKSVQIAKETGDLKTEGKAYRALGNALSYQGKRKEAIEYHMKYLEITKKMGDKDGEASAYNCLGNTSRLLGKNYDAIKCFKSSIDLHSQLGLKTDVGVANVNLGSVYESLGKYNEAMQCHQMSLETVDEHSKKNIYFNLGNIYSKLNKPQLAMECRLKFIILAVQAGDKRGEISYYQELGDCFFNQDELEEANKYYKKALVMASEINDSTSKIFAYLKLTSTYDRLAKWEEAIEFSETGLKIATDSGDKYNEDVFRIVIGILYWNLSHHHKERNDDDKFTQTIQQAEKYLRESLRCSNELFDDLREYHQFKISIVDTFISSYKYLTAVLIETNQIEEALVISERGRARVLKDILVSKYELHHVFATTSLREEPLIESDFLNIVPNNVCLLFCTFTVTKSILFWVLSTQKKPLICIENKLPQYCAKKIEEEDCFKRIGSIIPYITKVVDIAYKSMKVSKMAPNCEDRSFGNAKCIDEEDGKQPQLKTSMDYVQPRLDKSLEKEFIDSKYLNLSHFRGNESTSDEPEQRVECKEPLKELFKLLITPVQQHLNEDEIVIVPEGPLYSVPFAALQDPQTGRFLSETKCIRLAPSLTTLKLLKDCPADYHSKTGALVVGNPWVGEVMLRGEKQTLNNLPGAKREAEAVSAMLRVRPLIGSCATKDAVIEKLRESPAVIHIAAHGDDSNGQIALAPGISAQSKPIPEEEDYILTMKEVQEIGVRAQLVVLSCCHSGRGEIRAEGVVGMSRAFLAAGARAVVASLWSIDDNATLHFMTSFYKFLRYGDSASLSLKNAMEELRGNRRCSEPQYWAPFFLIGDDVTISKI
ncbi:hypothetical protein QZH41_002814 [Actinostola sp. cb2023]|nr:hypothetical protein QZH41_002814 [Actinostola sp. cb2023]